jgi:dTDP-glucose 4,6-dehydratase
LLRHLVLTYPEYLVVCYDNEGYCASRNNVAAIAAQPNFRLEVGDVGDAAALGAVLDRHAIDTVIHLAAESHVDHSFGNPFRFTATNVVGTQVLLEAVKLRAARVHRFIHMSTDEVYGEVAGADAADLTEAAILAPTNPYAASKAAGDMLVGAYFKSFGVPAIIVRCNNVYGPLQFPEKIIPKFVRLLQQQQACTLHGTGKNTRRYLFASDAVNGLDTVLHRGRIGSIYNVGSDTEVANIDICRTLVRIFRARGLLPAVAAEENNNNDDEYIEYTADRPFNDARYAIDSGKLRQLGWAPEVDFAAGLERTVDWYIAHDDSWWTRNGEGEDAAKDD